MRDRKWLDTLPRYSGNKNEIQKTGYYFNQKLRLYEAWWIVEDKFNGVHRSMLGFISAKVFDDPSTNVPQILMLFENLIFQRSRDVQKRPDPQSE